MTGARLLLLLALGTAMAVPAEGQRGRRRSSYTEANVPYGKMFTFVRLQYRTSGYRGSEPPWAHDYPRAERNFAKILEEVSFVSPHLGGSNVFRADDPNLAKYPVAYLSEPGYWTMSASEVDGMRAYLRKGGFLIVDDFGDRSGYEWFNFEARVREILPDARVQVIDPAHPIFNAFFSIDVTTLDLPSYRGQAEFLGVFEDNDPAGRLMMVVNYRTDIGEFWEYSDTGFIPIDLSNEAYKLGVNYVIYAMMH